MTIRLSVLDEGAMTAEQLKRNLDMGDLIEARVADGCYVNIRRNSNMYVMYGYTGMHCLSIETTDAARLHSHWRGYVENNRKNVANGNPRSQGH